MFVLHGLQTQVPDNDVTTIVRICPIQSCLSNITICLYT